MTATRALNDKGRGDGCVLVIRHPVTYPPTHSKLVTLAKNEYPPLS